MLQSVPRKVLCRVILNQLKEAVDGYLREVQAGFRKGGYFIDQDQIATIRVIVEQSTGWSSPLYIHFLDFEKAYDSLHLESLWKLLRHYRAPLKLTRIVKSMYDEMKASVIHLWKVTDSFNINMGVRQGCLLSPFLFPLAIDFLIKRMTGEKGNGIQWTLTIQLDDLNFADDIALLSHTHKQMQDKTNAIADISAAVGLKINTTKTKILRNINTNCKEVMKIQDTPPEDVNFFTHPGSIVHKCYGAEKDIKPRLTWRGDVEAEMRREGHLWGSLGRMAWDRVEWHTFVDCLCSTASWREKNSVKLSTKFTSGLLCILPKMYQETFWYYEISNHRYFRTDLPFDPDIHT